MLKFVLVAGHRLLAGSLSVVLACGGLGACARAPRPVDAVSGSPIVAMVAGSPIRADDVAAQMRKSHVSSHDALATLVDFELLAHAAADADVPPPGAGDRDALDAVKVQRLVEREIEPRLAADAIPDADVRALYDRGKKRYIHGRMVQIAVLCVFTGARMKDEARARAHDTARQLKEFVDSQTDKSPAAFDALANAPAWSDSKVSATTVWQTEDDPFPAVVGRAAAALAKSGDTTALVGDETGYYIARYVAEAPAQNVPFAEAAPALRRDMVEPWRKQTFLRLSTDLARGHEVEVFPDNVELIEASTP